MYVANFFERLLKKCVNRGVRCHRGGVQEVHGWDNYVGGGQGLRQKVSRIGKGQGQGEKGEAGEKTEFLDGCH